MPSIFKALTSITAWVLFITGLGGMVWSTIDTFTRPGGIGGEPYHFSDAVWWTISMSSIFLAVIVMKIRKGLE